jgi:hypothetical protein
MGDDTLTLEELVELARTVPMTAKQREAQRRSFAYGNAKIENDAITREMIDRVADLLPVSDDSV